VLTAPRAGVLDDVKVAPGETVEPLEPVTHLVVIDPLRIDVQVPLGESLSLEKDDPAWVVHKLPGDRAPVRGRVIHVAPVADAASSTRLVRVEVPNPEKIPAGGEVVVHFDKSGLEKQPRSREAPSGETTASAQPAAGATP
jgi:multidrug efflux pump subunit AcrA (membrane-fusion protein)